MVVSNSDGRVEGRLRTLAIAQVGDGVGATIQAVLDSSSVGVRKPDARIFELALAKVGVAPAQAVHVGDSLVYDVRGAVAAGVRPIHFDPVDDVQ